MKYHNLTLYCVHLLALFTLTLLSSSAFAANITEQSTTSTYQSTFDDYKPLTDDSLTNWKAATQPDSGSHSMQGMQHQMNTEQMAGMPAANHTMPATESMKHTDMKAMDHSHMQHDHTMASMEGMDHSQMTGMDHDEMETKPSDAASAIQQMNTVQMQDMQQSNHQHHPSDMTSMNHSMHDSDSEEAKHNHETTTPDQAEAHTHNAGQSHDHTEMNMPVGEPVPAQISAQTEPWQITPNLHPAIVHFPIALTLIALLLNFAAYALGARPISAQFAAAGHFTLWLAAIGAATAVLFGWLAYNSVNHDDAGHAAMLLHRAWAVPTAICLILLASWDAWKYRVNELMSVPALILLFVLSEAVAVTGWLGGELVYRHGIGVLALPASEGAGHNHHHDGSAHDHAHGAAEATSNEHTEHHHDDTEGESHEH